MQSTKNQKPLAKTKPKNTLTKIKEPNPNTNEKPDYKARNHPDYIALIMNDGACKYTKDQRRGVMKDLIAFAQTEERKLSIEQFCTQRGMRRATIDEWGKQDPEIKRMVDEARRIMGDRRYEMALFKEIDKDLFKWNQHKYDPECIENHELMLRLAQKQNEIERGTITVEIQESPQTNEVPTKKGK